MHLIITHKCDRAFARSARAAKKGNQAPVLSSSKRHYFSRDLERLHDTAALQLARSSHVADSCHAPRASPTRSKSTCMSRMAIATARYLSFSHQKVSRVGLINDCPAACIASPSAQHRLLAEVDGDTVRIWKDRALTRSHGHALTLTLGQTFWGPTRVKRV